MRPRAVRGKRPRGNLEPPIRPALKWRNGKADGWNPDQAEGRDVGMQRHQNVAAGPRRSAAQAATREGLLAFTFNLT